MTYEFFTISVCFETKMKSSNHESEYYNLRENAGVEKIYFYQIFVFYRKKKNEKRKFMHDKVCD